MASSSPLRLNRRGPNDWRCAAGRRAERIVGHTPPTQVAGRRRRCKRSVRRWDFDSRRDCDQRLSGRSASSSATACPPAYHCEDVPLMLRRACVADPAVCGDNVKQRGEACDDGNTVSDDGCRGDCLVVDTPIEEQQRVKVSFTVVGSYTPKGGIDTPFSLTGQVDAPLSFHGGVMAGSEERGAAPERSEGAGASLSPQNGLCFRGEPGRSAALHWAANRPERQSRGEFPDHQGRGSHRVH